MFSSPHYSELISCMFALLTRVTLSTHSLLQWPHQLLLIVKSEFAAWMKAPKKKFKSSLWHFHNIRKFSAFSSEGNQVISATKLVWVWYVTVYKKIQLRCYKEVDINTDMTQIVEEHSLHKYEYDHTCFFHTGLCKSRLFCFGSFSVVQTV